MENWKKIETYEQVYQAELNKSILEENKIPAIIINERDSLFLVGKIELFVEEKNAAKAKAILSEFTGLTKINSFFELKPIQLFQNILKENQIQTTLKKKESTNYIADNYELFVKNEDVDKVVPFLTGEKLNGWQAVNSYRKVRQAQFIVQILEKENIDTITIKKKDSNYHLEEILVYVETKNFDKAFEILQELKGYVKIRKAKNFSKIEAFEETLVASGINALIVSKPDSKFKLLVEESKLQEAEDTLQAKVKWVELKTFRNIINAQYSKSILEENGISAIIINEKDSSFMLGQIELHVAKSNLKKALKIIKNI